MSIRVSRFRIPESDLILKVELHARLDLQAIKSLLIVANASIAEKIEIAGVDIHSYLWPFAYNLGDGVEIWLSSTVDPLRGLTWGQLQTVVRGLWIYHIEEKRPWASAFDIYDVGQGYVYPMIGWGTIQKPVRSIAEPATSNAISRRDSPIPFALGRETMNSSYPQLGYSTSKEVLDEH